MLPLTIITKSSTLDVAAALDPPLGAVLELNLNRLQIDDRPCPLSEIGKKCPNFREKNALIAVNLWVKFLILKCNF